MDTLLKIRVKPSGALTSSFERPSGLNQVTCLSANIMVLRPSLAWNCESCVSTQSRRIISSSGTRHSLLASVFLTALSAMFKCRTRLETAPSSPRRRVTSSRTTMRFQAVHTVRISGRYGLRWNCKVTAPPPLTRMSNHPPLRVSVKPKRGWRSTLTRTPTTPSPCCDRTRPRSTDTRLFRVFNFISFRLNWE